MKNETKAPAHPHLSFDGCGINDRDEYRTRIATFTDKRGSKAYEYGPLFAAAPEMLAALERLVHPMADDSDVENAKEVITRARSGKVS